ncbi:MAG: YraN family protein [Planctomycetota bacterium]|nr:MAG: YraN family protein [Planctomycetota bacterium]
MWRLIYGSAQERGRQAERRVEGYYRRRGWRIAARNWQGGGGELDLVASRWRTLVVVEVRHRRRGDPLASIDAAKLARTLTAARALVRAHHLQRYRLRIDLAAVDERGRVSVRAEVQDLRGS